MRFHFLILMLCIFVAACSKSTPEPSTNAVIPLAPSAATYPVAATPIPVDEEPSEQVLRDLMFRQYEALNERGGLPATVTATGKSGNIRTRLYEVHKGECRQNPADPPGMYECGVNLMATIWWEGQREPVKPLSDSKRISVIRDETGVWIDCTYNSDRNSVCSRRKTK